MNINIFTEFYIQNEEKFKNSELTSDWESTYGNNVCFNDYFSDNNWNLAHYVESFDEAFVMLFNSYKGCDVNGIGVRITNMYDNNTCKWLNIEKK